MQVERLDDTHDRSSFRCGVAALDTWFADHALAAQRQDTARTFVLVGDGHRIVGYYSLTMGSVERAGAPPRLVRGLPRFPVPIVLLARLAIDQNFQAQGLGTALLYEALHRATLAAEHAAARLIVVDPVGDDARAFYERWGLRGIESDERSRLFIRVRDALASFPSDYYDQPYRSP